jgi:AsmA protein
MRVFRIVAIVAGALLALLVLAVIALSLFVDPNRYRGDIERVAKEHTARVLVIRGPLRLKLFPWLGLSVRDVELSNPPGYGTQPFLAVQNASIGVKLLPLLGKRVEVSRVALEGVSINLVSRGEENNWKDLGESKEPPARSTGSESPLQGALSIEGVDLSKSSLVYRDEVKKTTTQIGGLELHAGRLEAGHDRAGIASLEVQGTYLARSDADKADADLKPLPFSLRSPGLTLDSAASRLAPTKIELKLGEAALLVSLSGEKLSTDRVVSGSVTVPKTSPRKLLQSLGITPPVTRDSGVLSAFELQTNFRLTPRDLQLSALQLTLDETHVQGSAAIEDLDSTALAFDLNVSPINLDRYRPPVEKAPPGPAKRPATTAAAPAPAKAPTPLPLESLRKLNAHGTLRVAGATFSNLVFTNVVMPLMAKDGHIHLGPTQARLYGGSYNGDIVLDARPVQAQLSLNEHVHDTDIGALLKAALDSSRLSGHADANVAVTGVGNTDEAIIRSLNGKIDANVKQGALVGIDVVFEMQRANSLLKREMPPQRTAGPVRTVFNALQMKSTLDKGVLRIDDLRVETDFLKIHGGGTLDTVTEAINYQLVTSVNALPATGGPDRAAGSGLDALKSVEVPLTITGTLSSPTVRPDIGALAKGKLGQEVQQKAQDLVKKKLGDKLKDLFGH